MQKTSKLFSKISILILTGTVISVAIIGTAAYLLSKSSLTASIEQNQLGVARQTMGEIDRFLHERLMDIQTIAGENLIRELLTKTTESVGFDREAENEARVQELRAQTGPWESLFIVDQNGTIVLSSLEEVGKPVAEEPNSKIAYDTAVTGKPYYSDFVQSDDTGRPTVIFAAPIIITKEGKQQVIGAVIGHFSWLAVLQILEDIPFHILILNREGTVIVDNANGDKGEVLFKNFKHKPVVQKLAEGHAISLVISKKDSIFSVQTLVSLIPQTGYLSYKGSGWGLLLRTPTAVAFKPVMIATAKLVFLLTLIIILTSVVSWLTINKFVINPITDLTTTINAISAGDIYQKIHASSITEFDDLATSFNAMTEYLRNSTVSITNLKQAVADRAQAEETLKIRNNELERINKIVVGRELRMIELKKEIEELKKKAG